MKIIAIKGKNGSGKSTVAAMLAKKLDEKGISNKVLSFAEPLKKIVDKLHTSGGFDWEDRDTKNYNRNLLEECANAIKSAFSTNVFAKEIRHKLIRPVTDVTIISDLRFDSEHFELKDFVWGSGDKLIILEIKNKLTDNNPPEYELDKIPSDYTLIFNSEIETQLDNYLNSIL